MRYHFVGNLILHIFPLNDGSRVRVRVRVRVMCVFKNLGLEILGSPVQVTRDHYYNEP